MALAFLYDFGLFLCKSLLVYILLYRLAFKIYELFKS